MVLQALLPVVQHYNATHIPELFLDIAAAMSTAADPGNDAQLAIYLVLERIRWTASTVV